MDSAEGFALVLFEPSFTFKVGTNGAITFGDTIGDDADIPELFPPSIWTYMVAPFWQNVNTTDKGRVVWDILDHSLESVNTLIKDEQGDTHFNGLWMLVASWEDVALVGDSVSKTSP